MKCLLACLQEDKWPCCFRRVKMNREKKELQGITRPTRFCMCKIAEIHRKRMEMKPIAVIIWVSFNLGTPCSCGKSREERKTIKDRDLVDRYGCGNPRWIPWRQIVAFAVKCLLRRLHGLVLSILFLLLVRKARQGGCWWRRWHRLVF